MTGARGQLGSDMVKELDSRGHETLGIDVEDLDITDREKVMDMIGREKPDMVIHCAAWTAVDAAEDNEETCRRVNALGTEHIAAACRQVHAGMVYISTDYVFDGKGDRPWEPDDPVTSPLNVYGQTKYEGEQAVQRYLDRFFIVRIAWVFGRNGKNFVDTMLGLAENHDMLTVVDDQFGTPTYTADLVVLLADMIGTEEYGIYHATNEGDYITWYDFAREIFSQAGLPVEVKPVSTKEFGARALRPENSRLEKKKLDEHGFCRLPDWKDALKRYLKEMEKD